MRALVDRATRTVMGYGDWTADPSDASYVLVDVPTSQESKMLQPGGKTIAADGTVTVIAPPPPPPTYFREPLLRTSLLRTTDAVATEIWRMTLALQTGYAITAELLAVDAANGDVLRLEAKATVKRLNAGALVVGATTVLVNQRDGGAAAWAVAASVAGNDVILRVTGAAGRSIDWNLVGRAVVFSPSGQA